MKLPGIWTLVMFGMLLNYGGSARADICSFPTIDYSAASAPFVLEINDRGQLFEEADREEGFTDVAWTVNPDAVPRITDGPAFGFYDSQRMFGLVQNIGTVNPTANLRTIDGPFTFGMDDIERIVESLDDAVERHGLFDGFGTLATLTDPSAGGGALAVRINYRGQIVGTFRGRIEGREWLAGTTESAVPEESSTWPLLAGGILVVAISLRRRFRMPFSTIRTQPPPYVRRRRSTRLPAWMRA